MCCNYFVTGEALSAYACVHLVSRETMMAAGGHTVKPPVVLRKTRSCCWSVYIPFRVGLTATRLGPIRVHTAALGMILFLGRVEMRCERLVWFVLIPRVGRILMRDSDCLILQRGFILFLHLTQVRMMLVAPCATCSRTGLSVKVAKIALAVPTCL